MFTDPRLIGTKKQRRGEKKSEYVGKLKPGGLIERRRRKL
ncbi:MAG: hypothetical protein SBU_001416 [Candidatus Syntrophoarchaeum butanivorans]|uniref:Uncharacterized protein n=1 Tax=Candidatus Syntropharchaeum butanivorans TaxID=1839936 RepID=A0A1F2P4I1_9EURY|nr:MAG: hypothetical protein SBU_001416 [Candidatus Syntrophoarchaeum butanivorans]